MSLLNSYILFEDSDLLILNKPSGIHSAKLPKEGGKSIAQLIEKARPNLVTVSDKPEDYGLVNRLDFETSGILIAAKKATTWKALRDLLQKGEIEKEYLVVLDGHLAAKTEIQSWIGSPNRGASKVRSYKSKRFAPKRALEAVSIYTPIKYISPSDCSVVKVEAHSARRHQIRVHAASMKLPLLGDVLYGSKRALNEIIAHNEGSFLLHALRIAFVHPRTKKMIEIEAPLPSIFQNFLQHHEERHL